MNGCKQTSELGDLVVEAVVGGLQVHDRKRLVPKASCALAGDSEDVRFATLDRKDADAREQQDEIVGERTAHAG